MQQVTRKRASEALDFICEHPALGAHTPPLSLPKGVDFSMVQCCKHGYGEHVKNCGITVYSDDPAWERYKERCDEPEDIPWERSVEVPYEEFFGEPWKFDHVEYWYEVTFYIFHGSPYDQPDSYDPIQWRRYQGFEGSSRTFESLLMHVARNVRDIFGDFSRDDFWSKEENIYYEDHDMITCGTLEEIGDSVRLHPVEIDSSMMPTDGLLNLRWLQWYINNNDLRPAWGETVDEWLMLINRIESDMPPERKAKIESIRSKIVENLLEENHDDTSKRID